MTAGFLDPSPATSAAELTPEEQRLVDRIDGINSQRDLTKVALAVGLAFLVYHRYMSRQLKERMKDEKPGNMLLLAGATYQAFVPKWVQIISPHLIYGYLQGAQAAKTGDIPLEAMQDIAEGYAEKLGEHINEVSIDAMMAGYQAQLNRKVPAQRAMSNVLGAYGVPIRTMNSMITVWTGEDPKILSTAPVVSARDAKAAAIIDKALNNRADLIGDVESWTAHEQGKQLAWTFALRHGWIPETATKIWRTARDERVCPVCGPLHQSEVPVEQQFVTDSGNYWTPPLHPRCRCSVILGIDVMAEFRVKEDQLVDKSYQGDPYDRDRRGRFARQEARTKPVTFKEPAPKISLTPITIPDVSLDEPQEDKLSLDGGKISLGGGKMSLQKISLGEKLSLSSPDQESLETQKVSRNRVGRSKIELGRINLPSEESIKAKLGMDNRKGNDTWVAARAPMYTIIDSGNRTGELAFIDDKQVFVEYADVKDMLKTHWHAFVESEVAEHEAGQQPEYFYKYTDPKTGHEWQIDTVAFQEVLEWLLEGEEKPKMVTLVNETRNGDLITAFPMADLAEWMKLDDVIQESTPTVMTTSYVNATAGDQHRSKLHGSMSNPGTFRLVKVARHGDWDIDTPLAYHLAHFEPEDLYG